MFVAVAKAGGFSAAARNLGQPVATVSRRVAELESELRAKLFDRSTRQVTLTEGGQGYFAACQRILEDLREADSRISGEHHTPKGELCVSAPVGLGRQHLQPICHDFLRAFPEVDLRLQMADRIVNLLDDHVDVALRVSSLPDSSLIARPVGSIRMVVCASPDYLARRGAPAHPSELEAHDCINWSSLGPFKSWLFCDGSTECMFPIKVRMTTTMPDAAVQAAVAGLGLVQATSYQVVNDVTAGRLLPVLREFETAPTPVNFVYQSGRLLPQKVRAFLDFVTPRLSERLQQVAQILG